MKKKIITLTESELTNLIKRVIKEQGTKTGCIKGDCENGQGTYKWTDGDVYEGQWKDDEKNGQGTYKSANGDVYVGQYKDDKKNGIGTKKWTDGDVYKGQWKDGVMNGVGTYKWSDGTIYKGQFKNDVSNGQGTKIWTDGAVYEGQWKDDEINGQGTYTNPNGVESSGIWDDGKLDGKSLDDLDKLTQSNTECVQPTEPTHMYKDDKNYRYAKSGDCWWAKNITNNNWFNLTELVKTKPKFKISIDRLNDGTNLIEL